MSSDITILLTLTSTYTLSSSSTSSSSASPSVKTSVYTKQIVTRAPTSSTQIPSHTTASSKFTSSSISSESTSASISSVPSAVSHSLDTYTTSGTSKSLTLGLAIGIPVAIVCIFLAIIGGYFIYKRHKLNNLNKSQPFQNYNTESDTKSEDTLTGTNPSKTQPHSVNISSGPDNSIKRQSVRYFLRDRLSKVINLKDISDLEAGPSPMPSPGLISPMFLKRFKLSNSRTDPAEHNLSRNHGSLKLGTVVESDKPKMRKVVVVRAYQKRLDDEITVAVGDLLYVVAEYTDGWTKVQSVSGHQGIVPHICLRNI